MSTPTRVTIEVTEADIERARQNDSYRCVVAQAIARTVRDATNVDVDTQTVRFTVDGERRVYLTPYVVAGYVIAYDAGDDLEPFSFQLRDPIRARRKIKTEAGKAADRAADAARRATRARLDPSAKGSRGGDDEPRAAAKAAYAEAKARHAGEPTFESDRGRRRPPPRVFKTKRRSYGHRLLRVNQAEVV